MSRAFLSKSRYLMGLQCLKYLWLSVNDPEKVAAPDARTLYTFDQGHRVEELARKLFADGIEVPFDDFQTNVKLTRRFLREGRPVFQAGIMAGPVYSRVDVLKPSVGSAWDIAEIKSSTKVKEENLHDLAFQKHCCELLGVRVDRCYLVHVNNEYVRSGEIDPHELFVMEDVTDGVGSVTEGIGDRVKTMLDTIAAANCPDIRVGTHCGNPYDCRVTCCWDSVPDNTVLDLYRGGGKGFELLHAGIRYIRDIPETFKLTEAQRIQKWCDATSGPHLDVEAIRSFLRTLKYPIHYLDFETFSTAVPLFDGIRPYQNIPFQFSLRVVDKPGMMPWHFSFLSEGPEDPRRRFVNTLHEAVARKGSVVVYNKSFELGILDDLGVAFPEHRGWLQSVNARLVDLREPFRRFHYYSPEQKGSTSLKSVLPAVTGRGYEGLEISDGDAASLAYLAMTYGDMTEVERVKVRSDLEEYCGRDTEGMIWIVDRLREIVR